MTKPVEAVLIGAGHRGVDAYGSYALRFPDQLKFVAVAEPVLSRRERFAQQHRIVPEQQYNGWEDLLAKPQLARAALICTQDQMHVEPTVCALQAGYDVLLEKPMAHTLDGCHQIVSAANEAGSQLHICHVLRYTRHFQMLREIIESGGLGQIVHVNHRENVSFWHMAHSYVRGNWGREADSSPLILAKCCHDFDILLWMLALQCVQLSSIGSLTHFKLENAPVGAPPRCLDGCPASASCPYYAPWIYLDMAPLWRNFAENSSGIAGRLAQIQQRFPAMVKAMSRVVSPLRRISDYHGWPRSVVAEDPGPENLIEALRHGPYGRCVYQCDNDVVDHQVVMMDFEGDLSVTLTVQGHSDIEGRTTRINGSKATLRAYFGLGGAWIEVSEHRSGLKRRYNTAVNFLSGHGGGDEGLLAFFVESLKSGDAGKSRAILDGVLQGHKLAFAAEDSRRRGQVITLSA